MRDSFRVFFVLGLFVSSSWCSSTKNNVVVVRKAAVTALANLNQDKKKSIPTTLSFVVDRHFRGGSSSSDGGSAKKKKKKKKSTTTTTSTSTKKKKKKKPKVVAADESGGDVEESSTEDTTTSLKEEQQVIVDAMKEKDTAEAFGDAIRSRADILTKTEYLESINRSIQSVGMAVGAADMRQKRLQSSTADDDQKGKNSAKDTTPTPTTSTTTSHMKATSTTTTTTDATTTDATTTDATTTDAATSCDNENTNLHTSVAQTYDDDTTTTTSQYDDNDDNDDDNNNKNVTNFVVDDDDDNWAYMNDNDNDDDDMYQHHYVDIDIAPTTVIVNYFMKSHGGVHILQCLCSVLASFAGLGCIALNQKTDLCLTLLKRSMLFAMMKHISGLLAATSLAARAIPEIGLRNAKLWIHQVILDPVSQYVFYTACILLWLPSSQSQQQQVLVWDRVPWIQLLLVGPILLREVISIGLVLSDILVLTATCDTSSTSSMEQVMKLAQPLVNGIMKVLVSTKWKKDATPLVRQALLAKGISQWSFLLEVAVGILFVIQAAISVTAFFFAPAIQRPKFLSLISSLLCTHAYIRFLFIRSSNNSNKSQK